MVVQLSRRQETLLGLVVEEYIETNAPVGSKFLASRPSLSVSSSTIRTELAELENLGLLMHPHTSAGRLTDRRRIPPLRRQADRGRRRPCLLSLRSTSRSCARRSTRRFGRTTEAVAEITQLLAVTSAPPVETTVVQRVELVQTPARLGRADRHHRGRQRVQEDPPARDGDRPGV